MTKTNALRDQVAMLQRLISPERTEDIFTSMEENFMRLARTEEEREQLSRVIEQATDEQKRSLVATTHCQEDLDEMHALLWCLFPGKIQGSYSPGEMPVLFVPNMMDVNASAALTAHGKPIITIWSGVVSNLCLVNRLLMRCFDAQRNRELCQREFMEYGCDILKSLESLTGFEPASWVAEMQELLVRTTSEPFCIMTATQLHTWQRFFILCHEIAHHICGHLEDATMTEVPYRDAGFSLWMATPSSDCEFEADIWAMNTCIDTYEILLRQNRRNEILALSPYLLGGIDILLQLLQYREITMETKGATLSQTHPPFFERRKVLHRESFSRLKQFYPAAIIMGETEQILSVACRIEGKVLKRLLED